MKFAFPVLVRSTRHPNAIFTEIALGRVRIIVKDRDTLVAIRNDEDAYIMEGADIGFIELWIGKGQIVHKATLQELTFNLNRILAEQGRKIIEPIIDDMLVRKQGEDQRR